MAIYHNTSPNEPATETYTGKVVGTYGRGTYHDDYYYAIVYELDGEGTPVFDEVMYDSTAFGSGGWATVDAPEWVIEYRSELLRKKKQEKEELEYRTDIQTGKQVKVVSGRKIPIGTIGEVFWMGAARYGTQVVTNVGIQLLSGERVFTSKINLEVVV